MLASTVQFSTYDQSLPGRPRRPRGLPREARRYENRRAPTEFTVARSLRTQQRAYEPVPRTGLRSTHTPEGMRSTGSPPREPAELVSVPPSSTTPDACSPP